MSWLLVLFVIAAVAVLARIVYNVRKVRAASSGSDWDAKQISQLRSRGSDPFQPHEVDFFFGLPSEAACQAVRRQLEAEGFEVDARPAPDNVEQVFSLHARKSLRISVPDMQETTRRFGELARAHGGRYDGWTAAVVPQRPPGPP